MFNNAFPCVYEKMKSHTDNTCGRKRRDEGVKMVDGVEEMGNCSVDRGCVPR